MPRGTKAHDAPPEQAAPAISSPAGRFVAMPRAWLISMAALILAPWLVVAGIYAGGKIKPAAQPESGVSTDSGAAAGSHPWGQLDLTPIVISPPLEYVPQDWGPPEPLEWRFPDATRQDLERFFPSVGLSSDQVSRLISTLRAEPRINGVVVKPDADLVKSLSPEARASIYLMLGRTAINTRQHSAYRNFAPSVDDWLRNAPISQSTFDLVKPYAYTFLGFVYFADIEPVRAALGDGPELQRLAKSLMRHSTMLVKLRVPEVSKIDEIAEYWGRGGRRTDIRPLLESIAAGGIDRTIDVSHLLPTMARQHLYRYPKVSLQDLEKSSLENCFWTALNFFNTEPDDRCLNPAYAMQRLKNDYYIVQDNFQLGDIVAISDNQGNVFHVAVYLADNLVFGKNGVSQLSPWTIEPIERLKGEYVDYIDQWNVTYHRRKDL